MPDESAFSRAWRNRLDDAVHEYVHTAAHFVIKEVYDRSISPPEVRPKAEIVDDTTSSKDYRVRLFYYVLAVLLYNIWRLTDVLLKAGVDGEMDYAPVLTAGECVELVASAVIPHN